MKKGFIAFIFILIQGLLLSDPLKISISAEKSEFILFEPIDIVYVVENKSNKFLIIPKIGRSFMLENDEGKVQWLDFSINGYYIKSPCHNDWVLKPHQKIKHQLFKYAFDHFIGLGSYKITFIMDGTHFPCEYFDSYTKENAIIWHGKQQTPPVTFRIKEPEGYDAKVLEELGVQKIEKIIMKDLPCDDLYYKYPQSHYAFWMFLKREIALWSRKIYLSQEKNIFGYIVDQEKRMLARGETVDSGHREKDKRLIVLQELLGKYHKTGKYQISFLYYSAINYFHVYDYEKARKTFEKIQTMPVIYRYDAKMKASAKRFLKSMAHYGK